MLAARRSAYYCCALLYCLLQCDLIDSVPYHHDNFSDVKIMNLGEELEKESLPLQFGQRLYKLHGLKDSVWYEIKISYPASIPASFSIQLAGDASRLWLGKDRRLLNTEKLIFKASIGGMDSGRNKQYVIVTSEAAGVVAKAGVQEREVVLFNIVCDELSFGIPYKAWCVGIVAILCLVLAVIIPRFLPADFLLTNRRSELRDLAVSKTS